MTCPNCGNDSSGRLKIHERGTARECINADCRVKYYDYQLGTMFSPEAVSR